MPDSRHDWMTDESVDVAVIGAGVSGLSAAYELRKRKRSVVVLERDTRPGGIILTERVGEFVIDAGPDALLVQKPAAVALCNELGLGDRLFPTKLPRTAFVLRDGELHPLPGASILGFPTRLGAAVQEHAVRAHRRSSGWPRRSSFRAATGSRRRIDRRIRAAPVRIRGGHLHRRAAARRHPCRRRRAAVDARAVSAT